MLYLGLDILVNLVLCWVADFALWYIFVKDNVVKMEVYLKLMFEIT